MAKIYTKSGDKGETSLFDGKRVRKSDPRVEAYGNIDELNSYIGLLSTFDLPRELQTDLSNINHWLFQIGSDLATPYNTKFEKKIHRLSDKPVQYLEQKIDSMTIKLPELNNFILPGGSTESAHFQIARTICRRAERRCVELSQIEKINQNVIVFLNRLSDYLFVASRFVNFSKGISDVHWKNVSE